MYFSAFLATLLVSALAAAAATLPQPRSGAKPILRQATREQVIRELSTRDIRKRQSRPSGGVYPRCTGSAPANEGLAYAVVSGVRIDYTSDKVIARASGVQPDYLSCARKCQSTSGCFGANFERQSSYCELTTSYTAGLTSRPDYTSTWAFFSCEQLQTKLDAGDLTCCTYWTG